MLNILVHSLHIQEIDLKKLAKRPSIHPGESVKRKKKNENARKNFELQNLDIGTLKNVNISFEKEKKQERESLIIDKIKEKSTSG